MAQFLLFVEQGVVRVENIFLYNQCITPCCNRVFTILFSCKLTFIFFVLVPIPGVVARGRLGCVELRASASLVTDVSLIAS